MAKIVSKINELSFDLRYISDIAGNTPGCIRADLGEVDYPVPEIIFLKINDFTSGYKFNYAPTYGTNELISSISIFEKERLQNFNSPAILVTSGGQAALFASLSSILNPGDAILTDNQYYPPYANLAKLTEVKLINVDLEKADEVALDKNIKVLLLNSPNNPSGKVYNQQTLIRLAELANKNDWVVIEDAVYSEIYFEEKPMSISAYCPERCLIINSASKNLCMPGIRIGWIYGENEYIPAIAKMHRNMNSCPNSFFQKIVADFLPVANPFFKELREEMRSRRDNIINLLDSINWKYKIPNGSIYIMAEITDISDTVAYVEKMIAEARISAMPGVYFGDKKGSLRICFGAINNEKIQEFSNRLINFVSKK